MHNPYRAGFFFLDLQHPCVAKSRKFSLILIFGKVLQYSGVKLLSCAVFQIVLRDTINYRNNFCGAQLNEEEIYSLEMAAMGGDLIDADAENGCC
jgi:hypothetical protein